MRSGDPVAKTADVWNLSVGYLRLTTLRGVVICGVAAMAVPGFAQESAEGDSPPPRAGNTSPAPQSDDDITTEELRRTEALVSRYTESVGELRNLGQLLDHVSANAPEVLEARERLASGDAVVTGARKFSPFNPEVEGAVDLGLDEAGVGRYEATLKQRLEIAGQRGLRIEAAERRRQILQAELSRAEWDVHQAVHRLFRIGLVYRERLRVEREIVDFTARLLQITHARYQAGEEPRTSVIVSRAEMATARQHLVGAWVDYVHTLRKLGTTLGWGEKRPPQPAGELGDLRPLPASDQLVERALRTDPQLAVLREEHRHAQAELKLAEREAWPSPMFGVGYEREGTLSGAVDDKLLFIIGLPLPIWNRNQGMRAAAAARIEVARRRIENRETELRSRVLEQVDTVGAAYEQTQIFEQEVLPALETQLDLLREGFELGELSLLDVMNARDRLLDVQRQHLSALQAYFEAVSELERLLGAGVWPEGEK